METYWLKVEKTKSCWNWLGEITSKGYGRIQVKSRRLRAHRFFFELSGKIIPKDLELDHLCRNKRCVNPSHLEAVTHRENIKRAWLVRLKPNCPKGHPYNERNLYMFTDKTTGKKWRMCRKCRAKNQLGYKKS